MRRTSVAERRTSAAERRSSIAERRTSVAERMDPVAECGFSIAEERNRPAESEKDFLKGKMTKESTRGERKGVP